MKTPFFLFLLALTLSAGAQNVSGFYTGTLYNDSTKMLQKYELALSDYRGKIDGYSYVTFVKNDTFYYGIRKVKAQIIGDSLIVQDDKMVSNNFPEPPAKGVGRTITIPIRGQDSLKIVSGSWKTNQTKKYYSVPGSINLNLSTDSTKSPLIAHLQELNLIATPVYYQKMVSQPLAVADPKKDKTDPKKDNKADQGTSVPADATASKGRKKNNESSTTTTSTAAKDDPATQSSATAKGDPTSTSTASVSNREGSKTDKSKSGGRKNNDEQASTKTSTVTTPANDTGTSSTSVAGSNTATTASADKKSDRKKAKQSGNEDGLASTGSGKIESGESNTRKEEIKKERDNLSTAKKDNKPEAPSAPVLIPYTQRGNKMIQTIEVSSDSLVLAFYDNGVVDGDSVSVYLNGQSVVNNMRLTTVANKKIIPVLDGQDTELMLVAENLGRIPPNTGLITIRDGENYYQVNFSADLQTNATITIRRKKK